MELHTSKYSKTLIALKKYMIDYFKHFHRQMTILLYVPYQDKSNILIVYISPINYHCNHLNSVIVSF